jgi:putative transposase
MLKHLSVLAERRRRALGRQPPSDLLDHVIVLNQRHLKRLMKEYVSYYHEDRTHLALAKETPTGRQAVKNPIDSRKIVSMSRLGALHHRYDLAA